LTDSTRGSEGAPPLPSSPPDGPGCPSDLELSRFVDGILDTAAHAAMVAHLEACDDCREVVATVVAAEAALQDAAAPEPAPASPAPPQVWWFQRPVWLGTAAALAATAVLALRLGSDVPADAADPWADVASAVGAERTLEARLSMLPTHVPLAPPTRAVAVRTNAFGMRALAGRLDETAARAPEGSPIRASARHAAAVALLLAGHADEAGRALEAALAAATGADARAALLADLSAAHAAQGQWQEALEAARRARLEDPDHPAAAFNEALALERLGRADAADAAWRALVDDRTTAPAWRDEARRHLRASRQ
jgi:tetratricopeptide (TPR) repeat protein